LLRNWTSKWRARSNRKRGFPYEKEEGRELLGPHTRHDSTALYLISSGHGDLSDALT
jgi:hypothetical protein